MESSAFQILGDLSFGLTSWEDGDLMALASLVDTAQKLAAKVPPDLKPLALTLQTALEEALKGAPLDKAAMTAALEQLEQALYPSQGVVPTKKQKPFPENARPEAPPLINTEAFQIFLSEARERLEEAQGQVLELEASPGEKALIDTLFRTFHTIKGECGFLKIASLGELAHNIENLLDQLRSSSSPADETIIELLLQGVDYAKLILKGLIQGDVAIFNQVDTGDFFERLHNRMTTKKASLGDVLQAEGKISETDVLKILQKQKESAYTKKFGEIAEEENLVTHDEINEAVQKQKNPAEQDFRHDPLIKVRASQVNYLVDMIGELLIVGNQLDETDKNVVQLKKISRGIQAAAMQLRTVSVKNLFINIKRIARDAAKKLSKEVTVELRGEDLEIDRNLVEILEEPLMHLVRNSIGHGIENAEDRLERGKSPEGHLVIQAQRLGNNIIISVRDDGNGLDEEKILAKAVERGLMTPERRALSTRNDLLNLIFLPGFSTAEAVDAISGRGVGMDIVKSTVTAARGRVETRSEKGRYTEFSLIFPLSLAIIDGMIVKTSGTHFILPVSEIVETLKIETDRLKSVEGRVQVLNLRSEVIPVIDTGLYFFGEAEKGSRFAVIIELDDHKYALMVDDVVAKKEVVIKSLGKMFKNLPAVSSAAVLPGGQVGFVVNIEELVRNQGEA